MSKKLKVGIDINEVLRARWLQFDRFYSQEFGDDGIPSETPLAYTYDFYKTYRWEDTTEITKDLKEPDEMPDDINPVHYQVDEKTGEADADVFLFKAPEEHKLTAREVYNRFMYQDYCLEIHGSAPVMYRGMDLDVKNFTLQYDKTVDFVVMSVENHFSIPPTLFFLSKMGCRVKEYLFLDNSLDMWKNVDVLITSDPEILKLGEPWGKKLIKVSRPYNEEYKVGSLETLQINDLKDNPDFEKLIKYKK